MLINGTKSYSRRDFKQVYDTTLSDVALFPDATIIAKNDSSKRIFYYFRLIMDVESVGGGFSDGFKFNNNMGFYKTSFDRLAGPELVETDVFTGNHYLSEGSKYLPYVKDTFSKTHLFESLAYTIGVVGSSSLTINAMTEAQISAVIGVCLSDNFGTSDAFPYSSAAVFSLKPSQVIMANNFFLLKQAGSEARQYRFSVQSASFESYQDLMDYLSN